jgi:diphosphomevalonate decarboxylase
VSFNNFPTAAGLASSAAGFACLVYTIAQVYGIEESYPGELSAIARMGSGSACRSLYGGWVKWEMGEKADGSDSLAVQVADEKHWPEVVIAVLVVSEHRKPIGSTSAMERSVQNSDLLKHRAANVVPERMKQMEKAILERNFNEFGQLTIQDSNQFHAVCLDTYPPVMYLNDTSKFIINLLTQYNAHYGEVKAAYTFDAGPNAVIYTTKDVLPEILQIVHHYFPSNDEQANTPVPEHLQASLKSPVFPNSLQRIIQTNPGPGPILLDASAHLIDVNTGLPKAN